MGGWEDPTYSRHNSYILETMSSSLDIPPMSPLSTHECIEHNGPHARVYSSAVKIRW